MFMFLILGSRQTRQQIGALVLLLIAAMLLSLGKRSPQQRSKKFEWESTLWLGIIPIISASVLSGLASTLCQWAAQVKRRSTYLMTVEMSTYGSLVLLISMWWSPDGVSIQKHGFFYGWTILTFIPVILNAFGGILVGLVTQYSGGIKKGFVIVSALLVTALLEVVVEGKAPSSYAIAALPLVVSSTIIHQNFPVKEKSKIS
jgi:UDP-sugar transporter A1/2/3